MAASQAKQVYQLPPLPKTRRGYGIQIYSHPSKPKYIYTNGKNVIVRSLLDLRDNLVFSEHKADVNVARFSPNGNWVASGDSEGNVIIWSYPSMKVKSTFPINKCVLDLDWDADNQRIVAVGDGATSKVKVFTWDSGNNLGDIGHIHTQQVLSCTYRKQRPYKVVTASEDLTVNLYDGVPFKYNGATYKGHARYPNAVRYSPSGEIYASVGADGKIVVYDGKTGEVKKEFGGSENKENAHSGAIVAFDWSPSSTHIITASLDKTCKIWNIESDSVDSTFTFGNTVNDQQVGVLWHHDSGNDYLLSVSLSGVINYLDRNNTSTPKQVIYGHQTTIQSFALDHTSYKKFYSSGMDGELCEWDVETGSSKWLTHITHKNKIIAGIAVNSDATQLFTVGYDEKLRITPVNGGESSEVSLGGQPISVVASKKDAQLAVIILAQQKILLLRGNEIVATVNTNYTPNTVCWSHNEQYIYVGDKERKPGFHVYKVQGDNIGHVATHNEHDKAINEIAVSPDGQYVVSVDSDAIVFIRDANDSSSIYNKTGWRFHQGAVQTADFKPDSSGNSLILATGSIDFSVILWYDFKEYSGSERKKLDNAHTLGVQYVRWISEKQFVTVGADRVIRVWEL